MPPGFREDIASGRNSRALCGRFMMTLSAGSSLATSSLASPRMGMTVETLLSAMFSCMYLMASGFVSIA